MKWNPIFIIRVAESQRWRMPSTSSSISWRSDSIFWASITLRFASSDIAGLLAGTLDLEEILDSYLAEDAEQGPSKGSLRAGFARNWHYVAILYALVAGGIWVAKALNEENVTVVNLILSIFLIPIVIGVDQWVQRLLKIASGESRQTIDLSGWYLTDDAADLTQWQFPDVTLATGEYLVVFASGKDRAVAGSA